MRIRHHRALSLLYLGLCWLLWVNCVRCSQATSATWPDVTVVEQNAIRSERDIQNTITVDQLPYVGVNLRAILFNDESNQENIDTNTATSLNGTDYLDNFSSLLNQGIGSFILDIENKSNTWYILGTDLLLSDFLTTLNVFLDESNSSLSANIVLFFLRVHVNMPDDSTEDSVVPFRDILNTTALNITRKTPLALSKKKKSDKEVATDPMLNITALIENNMNAAYIYRPEDLMEDNNFTMGTNLSVPAIDANATWPTLESFIYGKRKRIIVTELSSVFNQSTSPYFFPNSILHFDQQNTTLDCPNSQEQFRNISTIKWRILESQFDTTNIKQYMKCGLSPIVTNPYSIGNVTKITPLLKSGMIWSWGPNEPRLSNSRLLMGKDSMQAYNCAMLKYIAADGSTSWVVDNCYAARPMLCKNKYDPFQWALSEEKHKYFTFYNGKDSDICPDNYTFSLPITQLEQRSLRLYLEESEVTNLNIWINLNSIAVSNCWLIGNRGVACPYQRSVSKRNFVSMLVPVVVISAFLLVCVLYLSLISVPIHDNRKNWRRVVNKISNSEMEGVPS